MNERIKKYDERMLTVIKNHLGCEDLLNGLLSAAGRRWKGRLLFAGKFDVAKEIDPPEIEPLIWDLMEAGNKLRNAIALRKAYLATLTPFQAKHAENLDDTKMVILAFGECGAYLAVAANAVKGRKKGPKADAHTPSERHCRCYTKHYPTDYNQTKIIRSFNTLD